MALIQLYEDGVLKYTNSSVPVPPGPTPPGPTPPGPVPPGPVPPGPTTGCSDSWGGGQDQDWTPLVGTKVFPQHPVSAHGQRGTSIRFVADAVQFPNGIKVDVFDQSGNAEHKDAVISNCPHDFSPVLGPNAVKTGIGNLGSFYIRFGTANPVYEVDLTPGQTYYINFRPSAGVNSVSTQFVFFAR